LLANLVGSKSSQVTTNGFFFVVGLSRVLLLPLFLLLFLAHLLVCSAGASLFLFDLSVDVFMICIAGAFHWIILFFLHRRLCPVEA
jgi:hypothetical protein